MRHDAIYRVYPNVVTIDDGAGAFDKDGVEVQLDAKKIDEMAAIIDSENAAKKLAAEAKLEKIGLTLDDLKDLGLA